MYAHTGLGLNFKLIAYVDPKLQPLKSAEVLDAYKNSSYRLFIFDHEEVIHSKEMISFNEPPSEQMLSSLEELSKDERNYVFVISSMSKEKVHEYFSRVKRIGLAAEDGFYYRLNSIGKSESEWDVLYPDL